MRLKLIKQYRKHPDRKWKLLYKVMDSWKKRCDKNKICRKMAHDPKHTTSSIKHNGWSAMAGPPMAASLTGTLLFMYDCTADRRMRRYTGANCLLKFSRMHQNMQPKQPELFNSV